MAINRDEFQNKVKANLWANDKYDRFYYLFKTDGRQKRGVLDYTDKHWSKRDRIRKAEKDLNEAKEKTENKIDTDTKVDVLVEMYFKTLPDTAYKKNRLSYYHRKVQTKLGRKRAANVLPAHIQTIINENIKNGDSPATAKQAVEVLSPSFEMGIANRVLSVNPCRHVKITLPPQKKIVSNATGRLKKIYDAIQARYADDPFYRSFYLLALQGRRLGELLKLRCEDVSIEHDYYVIRDTKNHEDQKIFLPPNAKQALSEFMGASGPVFRSRITGRTISNPKKQTARLKEDIGEWFSMHYMRNVIVSALAESGVDAITLSGVLGHKDATTINKYLTLNYLNSSKVASDMIQ